MRVSRTLSAPNLGGEASHSPQYSLFASRLEGSTVSFEPGIAMDHANQFCQWVVDVIVRHGGMMTSANLGSTLVAEDPERYATIKAVFGGLCGLLTRYPERFALVNNQPLNHVAVIGAAHASTALAAAAARTGLPHQNRPVLAGRRQEQNGRMRQTTSRQQQQQQAPPQHAPRASFHELPTLTAASACRRASSTAGSDSSGSARSRTNCRRVRSNSATSPLGSNAAWPTQHQDAAIAERDEFEVVRQTREILEVASEHALKAVDLANALRNRVGVDVLGRVRERHGGLLSLLEKHSDVVRVLRVPKHDIVTLASTACSVDAGLVGDRPRFDTCPPAFVQRRHTYDDARTVCWPSSLNAEPHNLDAVHPFAASVDTEQTDDKTRGDSKTRALRRSSFGDDVFQRADPPPPALASIWKAAEHSGSSNDDDARTNLGDARPPAFPTTIFAAPLPDSSSCSPPAAPANAAAAAAAPDVVYSSSLETGSTRGCLSRSERSNSNSSAATACDLHLFSLPSQDIIDCAARARSYNSLVALGHVDDATRHQPLIWEPPDASRPAPPAEAPACWPDSNTNVPDATALVNASASLTATTVPFLPSGEHHHHHHHHHFPDSIPHSARALDRLMSEDYVPTQHWPRDQQEDAALVTTVLDSLDHLRGCATLNKLRSALKQRHNLPRSVKSVPLRAFLASYSDMFTLDGAHVYLSQRHQNQISPQQRRPRATL